ncbi:hypothetical protein BKA01_008125 [Pseudonocardia eucalypti]|uniref:hypothetical protein n=1 Tax=Pseudonocardia eucalypti TaxID=648755 RepID=UPI0017C32763|nr:hypothetical protein [Pseudonocardia eucalypti]
MPYGALICAYTIGAAEMSRPRPLVAAVLVSLIVPGENFETYQFVITGFVAAFALGVSTRANAARRAVEAERVRRAVELDPDVDGHPHADAGRGGRHRRDLPPHQGEGAGADHVRPGRPRVPRSARGASGFLLKDASRDELVRAVRLVAAGEPARALGHPSAGGRHGWGAEPPARSCAAGCPS